jgi:hypothetical protein
VSSAFNSSRADFEVHQCFSLLMPPMIPGMEGKQLSTGAGSALNHKEEE